MHLFCHNYLTQMENYIISADLIDKNRIHAVQTLFPRISFFCRIQRRWNHKIYPIRLNSCYKSFKNPHQIATFSKLQYTKLFTKDFHELYLFTTSQKIIPQLGRYLLHLSSFQITIHASKHFHRSLFHNLPNGFIRWKKSYFDFSPLLRKSSGLDGPLLNFEEFI